MPGEGDQRNVLAAALSTQLSEVRLYWRDTALSCRWLVPDQEHCLAGNRLLAYLRDFRVRAAEEITDPEVRALWLERVALLIDPGEDDEEPVSLRTLTWLLLVAESPHREGTSTDAWNLYLWNLRLADLPNKVGRPLIQHLGLKSVDRANVVDLDTAATVFYAYRLPQLPEPSAHPPIDAKQAQRFNNLRRFRNLLLFGTEGIGKSTVARDMAKQWSTLTGRSLGAFWVTVLHPHATYQAFVEGSRQSQGAGAVGAGGAAASMPRVEGALSVHQPAFFACHDQGDVRDGLFVRVCAEAARDPNRDYLLAIEGIDNLDAAAVFGEVLHVLDPSARVPWRRSSEDDEAWHLNAGAARAVRLSLSGRLFFIPGNVYLIATASRPTFFRDSNETLLRAFAVEMLTPLEPLELKKALLNGRSHADYVRLEDYVEHSVNLLAAINGPLNEVGGIQATLGYGPLFTMAEEILVSADADHAAEIVLGTWRQRLVPPLLGRLQTFLRAIGEDGSLFEAIEEVVNVINGSWLRLRVVLEGSASFASFRLYDTTPEPPPEVSPEEPVVEAQHPQPAPARPSVVMSGVAFIKD